MPEISNLEIRVTAASNNAVAGIQRIASAAGALGGATNGATSGLGALAGKAKDMGESTKKAGVQSGKASENVKRFGKDAKDAGKNAEKGTSGISKFWGALKRVMFYRIVRSILREIANAFKEGLTNMYQWSSAVNGTFAKSMDKLASSSLYLKNSLGAMLAPIIERLTPVIEWIIDRIVDVINWINKLFAALSGSQTYVVAKKVATKWQDAGESVASSARSAAEDIRRTLLGFDEINRLEKEDSGSYGGGTGSASNGTDYTNMFEERALDGWMAKLAAFIDKFNLGVPAVLAGLLAGFEAIKAAIKAASKLSLGWLKELAGKTINIAVSLIRAGWTTLRSWAMSFGEAVVDLAVRIKTKAAELWSKFALEWAAVKPVVLVGVAFTVTAAAMWLAYKLAWRLVPDKMLEIELAVKTKASELWEGFKRGWQAAGEKVFAVSVAIATKASELWDGFKRAWNTAGEKVFAISVSIATSAAQLWQDFKRAWNTAGEKVLAASVAIATSAAQLWQDFKRAWFAVGEKILSVSAKISTTAKSLWSGLKRGWNSVGEKTVAFGVKISTTASSLWSWFKQNWKIVAAGALGIAIAIATPWSTIAASLSTLWRSVIASVGVLTFSVAPALAESNDPYYSSGGMYTQSWYDEHIAPLMNKYGQMPVKGGGGGGGSLSAGRGDRAVKNTTEKVTVSVSLVKNGWKSIEEYVGRGTSVEVALKKYGWTTISNWVGTSVTTFITLAKKNWSRLGSWVGESVTASVNLVRGNFKSLGDWVGKTITVGVNLISRLVTGRASGGVYENGAWRKIPQYAGGTTNAHGSLFMAGEAGPEIVGHVGGRTEILNQSQLASVMYSSIISAMAPVASAIVRATDNNVSEGGMDYNALADAMVTAMQRAGVGSVYLDGRQLAQSINRETQRRGVPAIVF